MTRRLPYRQCAGIVLAHRDGRVFAGERADKPGAWQMPQGGIDAGETARAAALRELEEETGVDPSLVFVEAEMPHWVSYDFAPSYSGGPITEKYQGQSQRWFLLRFQGQDADINLETAEPEFTDWAWLPPEDVLARIVAFKRDIYAEVLGVFADRLQR